MVNMMYGDREEERVGDGFNDDDGMPPPTRPMGSIK